MKKVLACLAISILILSGIRAPEVSTASRGICLSGAVLENAAPAVLAGEKAAEFTKAPSNPLLLHSGFAPSAHPFDFPETPALSDAAISNFLWSQTNLLFSAGTLFPHDRPPIL